MLIIPHRRILIITPPKCGSRSINAALCQRWGAQVWCGPSMGGRGEDHHNARIPFGKEPYEKYVVVRHPLDRLASLWRHLVDAAKVAPLNPSDPSSPVGCGSMAFYDFAAKVGRRDAGTIAADPFYGWALCDHLKECQADVEPLRLESLKEDLAEIGLPVLELPHLGKSNGGESDWRRYYDSPLLAAIAAWAKPDCERFSYEWPGDAPRDY